ncbi:MAG: sugar-binding domain-containing protein, partial [Limisphaerales bacterium]
MAIQLVVVFFYFNRVVITGMARTLISFAKAGCFVLAAFCLAGGLSFGETRISLAGKWRFALDPGDAGLNEHWFEKKLTGEIKLPGILQAQGYGHPISIGTPWVLSLYDHFWYLRADYKAYTNAGNVKVPFLCQPPRHYLGAAWYERDIHIPPQWKGKRVVLFLERPH